MRFPAILLSLCFASLTFYVGYEVGKNQQPLNVADSTPSAEESKSSSVSWDENLDDFEEEEMPVVLMAADEEPPSTSGLPGLAEMRARAAQRIVVLSDNEGRELAVEILETRNNILKVRRQIDRRIVDIPFDLLSETDRAFAEYLVEQRPSVPVVQPLPSASESSRTTLSQEEREIFDRIFGRQ